MIDLMRIPYVKGGRTLDGCDCYGLVRLARIKSGQGEMPLLGGYEVDDYRRITRESTFLQYEKCSAKPWAIAACHIGRLCTHFGIVVQVDGRIMVLDTTKESGPRLTPRAAFEAQFSRVDYYDDQNLSGTSTK